jgi:hypothetical protein
MANALIARNQDRPVPRALNSRTQNGPVEVDIIQYAMLNHEIQGVADIIQKLIATGTPPGDILVLAQRSVIGTPIYKALVARKVPTRSYYASRSSTRKRRKGALHCSNYTWIERTTLRFAGFLDSVVQIGERNHIRGFELIAKAMARVLGELSNNSIPELSRYHILTH